MSFQEHELSGGAHVTDGSQRQAFIDAGVLVPDAPVTPLCIDGPVLRLDAAGRRAAAAEIEHARQLREERRGERAA